MATVQKQSMIRRNKTAAITSSLMMAGVAFAFVQTGDSTPESGIENQRFPDPPSILLSEIKDFADDSSYAKSIADQVEELIEGAGQEADPAQKAGQLLAAANLILARQLEPHCTRALLRIPAADANHSAKSLSEWFIRIDGLIQQATEIVAAIPAAGKPNGDDSAPNESADLSRKVDTLRAFANGQRAYLMDREDADAVSHKRRAASALAPLLEDSDKRIASAARMWQAALRAEEEDPAAALLILEPALADPLPDAMPYAFFSRLIRARLIAERGGPAAALALLSLIEERANDWFTDSTRRADATRACAYERLRIVREWHDRLSPVNETDERAWCIAETQRVRERYFSSVRTVLRLDPAIPDLAVPPPAEPTKTDADDPPH